MLLQLAMDSEEQSDPGEWPGGGGSHFILQQAAIRRVGSDFGWKHQLDISAGVRGAVSQHCRLMLRFCLQCTVLSTELMA